jgi:hypothetical protein
MSYACIITYTKIRYTQALNICFTEFLYHLILSFPVSFFPVNTRLVPLLLLDLFTVDVSECRNGLFYIHYIIHLYIFHTLCANARSNILVAYSYYNQSFLEDRLMTIIHIVE